MMAVATYLSHLGRSVLLIAAVSILVFLMVRVVPGDAVDVLAIQGGLTQEQSEAMREDLGLTASWLEQYRNWLLGALRGDLGSSLRYRVPAADLLVNALPVTMALAGASVLLGLVLGVVTALLATLWPRSVFVPLVDVLNIWSIAVPTFCSGLLAVLVFSLWLGWLPVIGNFIVPIVILGVDAAGQIVKPLHEELKELGTAPHIRTARAKGLSPARILLAHILPSTAPLLLAMISVVSASFIGGVLTMEVLFGLPGIGSLTFNSISGRDYPLIQAVVLFLAIAVILINFATDLVLRLIDPRPEH
ncbi:ABC transporter permease [Phyllobacterium zundukense]|uniref:Peptide ABC transporter permease n=1 Tax=Phyllobacterium zundukense TaxID=1867719 RepID=A0A2N9VYQ2_9HYPH|nr:ABC transporter permease [Phyllobacterium zundukense]ATU95205.1 peptide ABC transporter permease [Phyllobacterium zundukense]PIO44620.1 peptide ABC transporter permease [Phyllobacterium zundukense]